VIEQTQPVAAPSAPVAAPSFQNAAPKPAPTKSDGLSVEAIPQSDFNIGQQISFRVTTEKSGYLVLVDVDAEGKISQIFPNLMVLSDPAGVNENANFLKAGQSLVMPDGSAASPYRFVAVPPSGTSMIVAILVDTPVQFIDLPDVPSQFAGQARAIEFIRDTARTLQILPATGRAARKPKWVFASAFYDVR